MCRTGCPYAGIAGPILLRDRRLTMYETVGVAMADNSDGYD